MADKPRAFAVQYQLHGPETIEGDGSFYAAVTNTKLHGLFAWGETAEDAVRKLGTLALGALRSPTSPYGAGKFDRVVLVTGVVAVLDHRAA